MIRRITKPFALFALLIAVGHLWGDEPSTARAPSSTSQATELAQPGAALAAAEGEVVSEDLAALRGRLDTQFVGEVLPWLQRYCIECHQGKQAEAMLDLTKYVSAADVARDHQTWAEMRTRLADQEMPPADADHQPTAPERDAVVAWIDALRKSEADAHAGDPGLVPVRRLSNSEYNYSVRDLTGVDIRPTREFPVDPANEAGFDNSADSLTMSPALLNKVLAAARSVSEHMVLTPLSIEFAPHPVMTDTDRDKYCVKRIVEFYERQRTDLADYFFAAWQLRVGKSELTLEQRATQNGLSAKYLRHVAGVLQADGPTIPASSEAIAGSAVGTDDSSLGLGPLAVVRRMWLDLDDDELHLDEARRGCENLRDFVLDLRQRLEPEIEGLSARGIHKGAQPLVLWKNEQVASQRQLPNLNALRKLAPGADSRAIADALTVPEDSAVLEKFEAEVARFCRIFPDAFYISERGRDYTGVPKAEQEKGRLLSAGFHSMMGYYRDDQPLMNLILTPEQRSELDRLWQELDFVTSAPMRQYTGFIWFERTDSSTIREAEFDFARAEDKSVTSPEMIERLSEAYLAKAERLGASETVLRAIAEFYRRIDAQIQWVEQARVAAEPHHLEALIAFASRAFRRDLTVAQRAELRAFYDRLRHADGLTHEEAVQDTLVSILMSPQFCYRVDLAVATPDVVALNDDELASRLSYFLWSSVPDARLRELARSQKLRETETLRSEVKRMLADDRSRGLAVEFGGQWLDYRRFESHNSVDRGRFPAFDDQLRSAMYEEPVRFLQHVIQQNRPVMDCLTADYVILNSPLAAHYGVEDRSTFGDDANTWQLIPSQRAIGRGGLLGMSVFLTQNAPGLRTSPVKRGYWVVRRLLGERIPPPPPNVPELPSDESTLGSLTLRETLARHRDHASCASCHNRFDAIGLVFENYGPIGELRQTDLAGNAVDTQATFPNGEQGDGIGGLQSYLVNHRGEEFVDNLIRKLLSFALGRTLLLSDEPLVESMRAHRPESELRFGDLIETIVLSPQFLNKRGAAEIVRE